MLKQSNISTILYPFEGACFLEANHILRWPIHFFWKKLVFCSVTHPLFTLVEIGKTITGKN